MPMGSALLHMEDLESFLDETLAQTEKTELPGPVVGLVAPHLDYPRDRPCYGQAYATLCGRPVPDRVVVLGTNHFGRSTSVVATASGFLTPLGKSPADVDFLERIEARCGHLRTFDLDHAREHSIELQVAWLQRIFGTETFKIVAFLCPDPCGPTGTAPFDGQGVDLAEFARALGEEIALDGGDTLVVAGADLSHVGMAFGDERALDESFLNEVRRLDENAIASLVGGDADGWIRCVATGGNPGRICSVGCVYALATAIPNASATLLGYHQAVDRSSQTCVTCTAVVFTQSSS